MKTFDIVIVNWNSGTQLKECIDSINKSNKTNSILNKIIVVDNASDDNSINILENNLEYLQIIKNNENLGFGKACNQGAKYSSSDFILFLNPDMLIFEDTFSKLFDYIERQNDENIKVYGVQLVDENDNVQRNCARLPSLSTFLIRGLGLNKLNSRLFKSYTMEDWNHQNTQIVDQVMGAFFMVERSVFNHLNGFDERYFVYYEELDFSKRLIDSGFKTLFISEAKAYHKGGGTSENIKAKRLFYNTRSKILYGFKNLGLFQGILLMLFTFFIEPLTRTLFLLTKMKFLEILENWKGFIMLFLNSSSIIRLGVK